MKGEGYVFWGKGMSFEGRRVCPLKGEGYVLRSGGRLCPYLGGGRVCPLKEEGYVL